MKEEKETPATNLICITYKFKKMFYVSYIPSIYWKGGWGTSRLHLSTAVRAGNKTGKAAQSK